MYDATIVPVSAKTTGTHKWHPISVTCDSVIVRGGYNTSREPANSITLDDSQQPPGTIRTFVELDKNARWFLKGVGGSKAVKGDLKAVEVLAMLRAKLKDREAASRTRGAAVAAPFLPDADRFLQVEPSTDIDPMDELDAIAVIDSSAQPKPLKYRKLSTYDRRALVETLTVPTRPICTGRGDGDTTTISVYRLSMLDSRSNARLYLRTDCIDWLLAYAADELHYQGVIAPCPVPQSRPGNCSAVAGLRLEWAFAPQEWACEFVDGPLLGTTRRFPVRDLTKAQFAEMRSGNKINAYWSQASPAEKRIAAMAVALEWASSAAARVDAQSCGGPPESQVAAVAVDDGCLAVAGA